MQFRIKNKSVQQEGQKLTEEQITKITENPQTVREVLKNEVTKEQVTPNDIEIKNVQDNGNGKTEPTVFKEKTFTTQEVLKMIKVNNEMEVKNRVIMVRDILNQIIETGGNEIQK